MASKTYTGVWKFVDDDGNVTVLKSKADEEVEKINKALPFTIEIDDVNKTINFIDRK